ncbi:DNA cytosine methyltransferase [Bradyrhizobium symbiodeficiens]|uniref:DNA cytosine methyltransferase n=1 Tax=Bradyrhizobium symbiodeficiens TaxID=1404367 RepID=UPI00140FC72A|nr:DNA cytosine methyltransferase [Bradyrhizobium symbiodeficiens]QIP03939.1 DNA cytosine methyltransferase [Bradyrhizobium symbiodeficiens]
MTKAKQQLSNTQSKANQLPKIVSLFSGAGGLDHGFKSAGFKLSAAFDISPAAIETHKRNFRGATATAGDLIALGPRGVASIVKKAIDAGSRIGIIGGPPCQGFSRANTTATASDPRNQLPKLYIEIVQELQRHFDVEFVVFENVLGMRDKKHSAAYQSLLSGLRALGFDITEKELCALDFGVPQTRRRIVLSAIRTDLAVKPVRPRRKKGATTVREAIGALPQPKFFSRDLTEKDIPHHPNHWTMNPISPRFQMKAASHGGRCFKQLTWQKPSPTIAFGHREIYVHPNGKRRLSILEAMLLQGFPRTFVLKGNLSEQVEQVSNAVPPPLAKSLASAIRRSLGE